MATFSPSPLLFSRAFRRRTAAFAASLVVPLVAASASAQPLVYYGGGVISNVEVIQVAWTSGVDATFQADLTGFYKAILGSTYLDWLSEYDTLGKVGYADGLPGSEQHIGRGTFLGAFVIEPLNGSTLLTNDDVAAELVAQLDSGALPAPKLDGVGRVVSLYMFDFPAEIQLTSGTNQSCVNFDAYHSTVLRDGLAIPFGAHPDCAQTFGRRTTAHSHELVEAITDPDVGLASFTGRPMAWREAPSVTGGEEISDLCQSQTGLIGDYKVTKNWSNYANACVVEIPICDGILEPPACRPCIAFDSGFGCSGETPLCAEEGPRKGQCIACTAEDTSACGGATPLCDTEANTCVGCLTDVDCTEGASPVCDGGTGTCRGCAATDECSSGVCDTSADEAAGQCVECVLDADCGAGQLCAEHACAPRPAPADAASDDEGCSVGAGAVGRSAPGGWLLAGLVAVLGALRRRARRP